MSILVEEQDFIKITVYFTVVQNKHGYKTTKILEDDKAKVMLADPDKASEVQVLNTVWSPQSWHAQNELFSNSTVYNPSRGDNTVDWTKFRHNQFVQCLIQWDAQTSDGRPLPVNEDNINKLNASIANALSNKYSEATSLEEDEIKK